MVERLLLVDPGGIFPCQGKEGAFLAILFKWGVPMWHLRALGRCVIRTIGTINVVQADMAMLYSKI
jgi:hypothetical protein